MERRIIADNVILVSKTDTKGIITYANKELIKVTGYSEKELIGEPHNIIRHPDMPKVVFDLLWQTLRKGDEINAYVINKCKDNCFYWVLANVTPSVDINGNTIGYHSTRHAANSNAVSVISSIYKELLAIEKKEGVTASLKKLGSILEKEGVSYEEFILSL